MMPSLRSPQPHGANWGARPGWGTAFEAHLAIPKDQRQRVRTLLVEQDFDDRVLHKCHRLLSKVVAFDRYAVFAKLGERGCERDEIGIDVSAADASGAAHGAIINLNCFHI